LKPERFAGPGDRFKQRLLCRDNPIKFAMFLCELAGGGDQLIRIVSIANASQLFENLFDMIFRQVFRDTQQADTGKTFDRARVAQTLPAHMSRDKYNAPACSVLRCETHS
jgi:hypothetical protein